MKQLGIEVKKHTCIILVVVVVFQIALIYYYGTQKYEYHPDEVWSYGLSNSYYKPFYFPKGYSDDIGNKAYGKWMTGNDFFEYLTVQKGEAFSYGSVYYNQTQDVHPPLFYFILHTVCSFFPNTFSKWYGITINMVFFALSQLALFKIGSFILKSKLKALLPCIFWGFSLAAMNNVIFIRMYMMLTCFVLITTFLHIKFIGNGKTNAKILPLIFVATFLAGITHYYFLIYAFFLSLIFCIYLLFKKKYKLLIIYSTGMILSVVMIALFFTACLNQLFGTIRGTEAINNVKQFTLSLSTMSEFTCITLQEMFGIKLSNLDAFVLLDVIFYVPVLAVLFAFSKFMLSRKHINIYEALKQAKLKLIDIKNKYFVRVNFIIVAIMLAALCDIYLVSIIRPDMQEYNNRYYCDMFPFVALLFILILDIILRHIKKIGKYTSIIVLCLICYFATFSNLNMQSQYIYPKTPARVALYEDVKDADCIYMTNTDLFLHTMSNVFMNSDRVFPTRSKDTAKYIAAINSLDPSHNNLLIIDTRDNPPRAIKAITKNTKYKPVFLCSGEHVDDYFIYKLEYKGN